MSFTKQQAESALKPHFDKFLHAVDNVDLATVESYYHPNGVVIHKDKECTYGKPAIAAEIKKFTEMSGKSVTKLVNVAFEGTGDYLIVHAETVAETEKMGTLKGKFLQIWKKEGEKHLIYHDEFEIIA